MNFHTSHMPFVAQGCVGAISCESGQTLLGTPVACDVGNLGSDPGFPEAGPDPYQPGLDLQMAAGASVTIAQSTFETSTTLAFRALGDVAFVFRDNTLGATSLARVVKGSFEESRPAFSFDGLGNSAPLTFQGNHVLRSWVQINGKNWDIGGLTTATGNIFTGTRGGLIISGEDLRIRGNYIHPSGELAGWNQLAAFLGTGQGHLVESNIIRGGNWLVRGFGGGELRYNLLGDAYAVAWIQLDSNGGSQIHHNIFVRNNKLMENYEVSIIRVLYDVVTPNATVYNNTIDGGGACYDVTWRAIAIDEGAFLQSLRSNAIVRLPMDGGLANSAIVGPNQSRNFSMEVKSDPAPVRLGYADYNLFDNPDATTIDNYALGVQDKTERTSDGFALHDAHAMGAKDEQVDPLFAGPLPVEFPFSDDDVVSGAVSVCQILAFYRTLYTPMGSSPLVDTGDTADGSGNDIGAVGAGVAHPDDRFGLLCPEAERTLTKAPTVTTKCTMPIGRGGKHDGGVITGTGGGTVPMATPGFMCVCSTTPPGIPTVPLGVSGVVGLWILRRRKRRPAVAAPATDARH